MNTCSPNNIAIIACPGGENFADKTIEKLNSIYRFILNSVEKDIDIEEIIDNYVTLSSKEKKTVDSKYKNTAVPNLKVKSAFTCFLNGEFKTEILESIRGKDVYIFQDVENKELISINNGEKIETFSVNDHLMSLIVTIDAVRHAGAGKISLVLPVYPYSRQHKKKGREGLTASLLGHIYENLGVEQIITLDIHSREIENAFHSTRLQNLHASYQIIKELSNIIDFSKNSKEEFVIVSPDSGAVDRNKFYSSGLKKPLAMIYKERDYSKVTQDANKTNISGIKLLGDVDGKNAFLADDMLGSGGTLIKGMKFLKDNGAKKVIAAVSLPFFNGNAINNFDDAYKEGLFHRIIGTNAVYHKDLKEKEWYIETDVSDLFAQTIIRLHENLSLSRLLDNRKIIEDLLNEESSEKM